MFMLLMPVLEFLALRISSTRRTGQRRKEQPPEKKLDARLRIQIRKQTSAFGVRSEAENEERRERVALNSPGNAEPRAF